MGKSRLTLELEQQLWKATTGTKRTMFGCFEVTVGRYGKQRVDFLIYDNDDHWRCYEIKVSKSDFYSKCHNTFVGHYNYYVLTNELYQMVKHDIPKNIGVMVDGIFVKKSRKQELGVDERILIYSMIRSLSRDVNKNIWNKLMLEGK